MSTGVGSRIVGKTLVRGTRPGREVDEDESGESEEDEHGEGDASESASGASGGRGPVFDKDFGVTLVYGNDLEVGVPVKPVSELLRSFDTPQYRNYVKVPDLPSMAGGDSSSEDSDEGDDASGAAVGTSTSSSLAAGLSAGLGRRATITPLTRDEIWATFVSRPEPAVPTTAE